MIIQKDVRYNVIGYNFSWNVWSTGSGGSGGYSHTTDVELHHGVVHGVTSIYTTLIEGNEFEKASTTYHEGGNTFFRNKLTDRGIDVGGKNNAVGNQFAPKKRSDSKPGNSISGVEAGSIVYGNYTDGSGWNDGSPTDDLPNSYYLSGKPAWFGNLSWPSYGGDVVESGVTGRNPAEFRFWSEFN